MENDADVEKKLKKDMWGANKNSRKYYFHSLFLNLDLKSTNATVSAAILDLVTRLALCDENCRTEHL